MEEQNEPVASSEDEGWLVSGPTRRSRLARIGGCRLPATAGIAGLSSHITIVAPDKGAEDCFALRAALLFDSLAGELGR